MAVHEFFRISRHMVHLSDVCLDQVRMIRVIGDCAAQYSLCASVYW